MAGEGAPIRGATASPKENSLADKKLPTVLLRAGEDRRVRSGHPWAFSNEILMDAETKAEIEELEDHAPFNVFIEGERKTYNNFEDIP